jgi:hypothetical protein
MIEAMHKSGALKPMNFKKAHYEKIAEVMHSTMPTGNAANYSAGDGAVDQWEGTCLAFLNHFRADNNAFDADRFLAACRGEKHGKARGKGASGVKS